MPVIRQRRLYGIEAVKMPSDESRVPTLDAAAPPLQEVAATGHRLSSTPKTSSTSSPTFKTARVRYDNRYVPRNMPAIGDLTEMFHFGDHDDHDDHGDRDHHDHDG